MEITFFGVRGSIAAPGPSTARYGGNTACVLVRLASGELIILDCGTGARNLGLHLLAGEFGRGEGCASFLLSHAHWDHIQGFPFFGPFYTAGNRFTVFGGAETPARLEEVLERQMAAQYFPVQTIKNLTAHIEMRAAPTGVSFLVGSAVVRAHNNPHGLTRSLAFRIEERPPATERGAARHLAKVLVYASDAGYGPEGPSEEALALYAGADLLIHDASFTPEDRAAYPDRGLSSSDEALEAALRSRSKRLVLFHYDQDYSDRDVDQLLERSRRRLEQPGAGRLDIVAAAEGLVLRI
jgi:phosphoribosyl 1,2-cyclic phosphodiesterase